MFVPVVHVAINGNFTAIRLFPDVIFDYLDVTLNLKKPAQDPLCEIAKCLLFSQVLFTSWPMTSVL